MNVDNDIKSKIMFAMRDECAGGSLEIGTANMRTVLASFKLDDNGGSVSGPVWTLGIVTPTVDAPANGRAERAQIKDRTGRARITGLTVGMRGEAVDVVLSNTQINKGQRVSVDGNQVIEHA